MSDLVTSTDIDTFMGSANNAAARINLGINDASPRWTYTAAGGAPAAGLFTTDNTAIAASVNFVLSKSVVGSFSDKFVLMPFGSSLNFSFNTASGPGVASFALANVTDDGSNNPHFLLGNPNVSGSGALWADVVGPVAVTFIPSTGTSTPIDLAYAASLTPDASLYPNRAIVRITGWNGTLTLNAPMNGADGQKVEFWATAVGGSRALTLNAALIFPSLFTPTNPITIASGKKIKIGLTFDGVLNQWEVDMDLSSY